MVSQHGNLHCAVNSVAGGAAVCLDQGFQQGLKKELHALDQGLRLGVYAD